MDSVYIELPKWGSQFDYRRASVYLTWCNILHSLSQVVLNWPENVRKVNKAAEHYDFNKIQDYDNWNNVIKQIA